jgi:ribose/xylose/arabinose/galactoside ABC-type transport system permease subunit
MQRGLRQAAVLLAVGLVVGLVAAALWMLTKGGGFRVPFAVTLMAMGALLALTGGNALSRSGSMDTFAFLGKGPESDDPYAGEGLTNVGMFLFVALPLLVVGLALYGTG